MKKNLLHIILSNILYLLLVAGNNFLLPKFTSVEVYAAVKEYTLYITTYGTILTFGYTQGMYIRYGGKEVSQLDPKDVGMNVCSFFCLMLPVSIAITIYGMIVHNSILTVLGVGLLSTNLGGYYQSFYQATGDFKSYGVALNASRFLTLGINALLIFVLKAKSEIFYVGVSPLIGITVAIYLTIVLNKRIHFLREIKFSLMAVKENIADGFVLMIGDFVTKFFSSIDKWFIKYLMDTFYFAMYSFAVSMENLVNTFMAPVTVSMYNFFCKGPSLTKIRQMKELSTIYSFIVIAGAFPCKWILEHFMQNYISSAEVVFLLFAAQGLSTIIKGIYVNKYKADGTQNKYLQQMIAMLILAAILNGAFYMVKHSMIAIALATLVTNIVWLVMCEVQNPELRYNVKTTLCILIMLVVYIFAGYGMNSIVGCILYCVVGLVCLLLFMRESFMFAVNSVMSTIKSKMKLNK